MGSIKTSQDGSEGGTRSPSPQKNGHTSLSFEDYQIQPALIPIDSSLVCISNVSSKDSTKHGDDPEIIQTAELKEIKLTEPKFTGRQIAILIIYGLSQFFLAVLISLQSPFYPAEAEKKGLTATEYGLVFGIFEFAVFVSSFVYGSHMNLVGPTFTYNLGLLGCSISCIFFGFLDMIEDRTTFFVLSMVVRIFEALSDAAAFNAAFVIIAMEFPDSVATTFASMETIFGIGLMVGPIVGGALYDLGGFLLPFLVTGIVLMGIAIITYFKLPRMAPSFERKRDRKFGLTKLLTIPKVVASCFTVLISALSFGYVAATLEPHIRIFELTPIEVGLVIVINGGVYAVVAPVWGWVSDRHPYFFFYMTIGSILTIVGFLLIGPFPFLPLPTTLWITCIGLGFQGLGMGTTLVSCFLQILQSAKENGFPDSVKTYSLVTAFWISSFSLGNFFGPTISGILYDTVGFRMGTLFVIGCNCLVLLIIFVIWVTPSQNTEKRQYGSWISGGGSGIEATPEDEMNPLLGNKAARRTYNST